LREFLTILLEKEGYEVTTADTVASGTETVVKGNFDLVMCDLKLPDGSGLEVLSTAQQHQVDCPFIIITAHTTPQHALEALRAGAAEYLSKPFDVDDLKLILEKLLGSGATEEESQDVPNFIGSSPAIRRILDMVPRLAATPSTVFITGESGTGKELLAQAIHAFSAAANGPFLSVNCGALPEGLLESELFGHVRGSFTGAVRDHKGMFVEAEGGTLLLDEVGELTPLMQVKLLRVLQERRVRPVGSSHEVEVSVRVLAATNRDLEQAVKDGEFREDLYYRLNVLHIHLPPLRQRIADLPELARHFVERTCENFGTPAKRLTPDALRVLQAYSWPGNVRELENVIERTVALEGTEMISSGSLPEHLRGAPEEPVIEQLGLPEEGLDIDEYMDNVRRSLMREALEKTDGHQKKASELLRMSYRAFRYHAEKLGQGDPMKRILPIAALLIIAACSQPTQQSSTEAGSAPPPTPIPLPQAVFADGFAVDLELAVTADEVASGLMFRPSLPDNRGMLFLFDQPRLPSFWMKNMLIPLDLVFLDEAGVVVDVIADVQPCAAEPCPNYPPSSPAQAVLEINAGSATAHGIEIGTVIQFERVPSYPASD
jgi:DNA-binding NtrC family response regulator/uncharacterized membrane protein (UPF0127 family)